MNVLVTGGAGYIGSHTCVELLNEGYGVVVIDNLCNSNPKSLERVKELTGKELTFYEGDVRDEALLTKIFAGHEIVPLDASYVTEELQAVKDEMHERYYGKAGYRDAKNFVLKVKGSNS